MFQIFEHFFTSARHNFITKKSTIRAMHFFLAKLQRRFGLKHPDVKETSYQQEYSTWVINQARIGYYLAILMIVLQGVVDLNFSLDITFILWQLRLILITIVVVGIAISYTRWFSQHHQSFLATSCFLSSSTLISMFILIPEDMVALYYGGLIVIFIWALFVGLRSEIILLMGLSVITLFNVVTNLFIDFSFSILLSYNCFLSGSLTLIVATSFALEKARRTAFIDKQRVLKISKAYKKLAFQDNLTKLPNRLSFEHSLDQLLKDSHQPLGILFIDLDDFKPINDHYGHAIGDQVLKCIAQRLNLFVNHHSTIARIGGDEFVMLVKYHDPTELQQLATQIIGQINQPIRLSKPVRGVNVQVGASIGISQQPRHNNDLSPKELIKEADCAMYQAKDLGKNNFAFFSNQCKIIPHKSAVQQ